MFCVNCGKKIEDNGNFCVHCGARVGQVIPELYNFGNYRNVPKDSSLVTMLIVVTVSFLAQIILLFVDSIYVSTKIGWEKHKDVISLSAAWEGDYFSIIKVLVIIMTSISIITCIVPFIENDFTKLRRMIIAKITVFLNSVFLIVTLILVVIGIKYEIEWVSLIASFSNSDISDLEIKMGLTSGGWIYLICCLININLLFIISAKTKELSKQKKK